MPFLIALCVAYWKRKIMSSGCKGIVQKSSACLTMGFVTTICTDLARKLISQDELEETRKAIRDCQTAGVNVKFISQDDISVVRAVAIEFGILTENSEAAMLKGEDFRNFSEEERIGMVDQITAIGNCLPSDKLLLMQCLKKKGNVVALTGANDLHDTPALRQADIGFVKADWGTKMARDYLDLMVWDGTWSPVPNIIRCGRCSYENIQKFIQLELTMILSGLSTTTILTISSGEALMTPIQVSRTNLIVPVLGGMAVITEPPGEKLMNKPPVQKTEPLITKAMRRNIIAQVVYQVVIFVIVQFRGQVIYGTGQKLRKAMMFNSFVLLQVFNQFNSIPGRLRRLTCLKTFIRTIGFGWLH